MKGRISGTSHLTGPDGSVGARHDEHLLRVPHDLAEAEDDIRLQRIHDEIERGFDALRDIEEGSRSSARPGWRPGTAGMSSAARRPRASPGPDSP